MGSDVHIWPLVVQQGGLCSLVDHWLDRFFFFFTQIEYTQNESHAFGTPFEDGGNFLEHSDNPRFLQGGALARGAITVVSRVL